MLRIPTLLILLFAIAPLYSSCVASSATLPALPAPCTISEKDEATLLALPYQDFDQSPGKGWRSFGDKMCYHLAGGLLDRYKERHSGTLHPSEIRILSWHAGQMYAFDYNYPVAKDRFQLSHNPEEPSDTPLLWNDYVAATLAFLNKDLEKLRLHRDRIANGPVWNGGKGNLDVVDGLIKCFEQPYSVAYSTCR